MKLKPLVLACSVLFAPVSWAQTAAPTAPAPTTAEAEQFVHDAEAKLEQAGIRAQRALSGSMKTSSPTTPNPSPLNKPNKC